MTFGNKQFCVLGAATCLVGRSPAFLSSEHQMPGAHALPLVLAPRDVSRHCLIQGLPTQRNPRASTAFGRWHQTEILGDLSYSTELQAITFHRTRTLGALGGSRWEVGSLRIPGGSPVWLLPAVGRLVSPRRCRVGTEVPWRNLKGGRHHLPRAPQTANTKAMMAPAEPSQMA